MLELNILKGENVDKAIDYLSTWAANYFKSKDAITKSILNIEKNENGLRIRYKHKELVVLAITELDGLLKILEKFRSDDHLSVITINSSENVKFLLENWKKISAYKFLSIYFINPFSDGEKKWIIYPYTHSRIADEQSLKQGIKSLSEAVPKVDVEEFTSKI